jgi:undecaprenyl pyrophosphate phosphatase UppP
MQSTNNSNKNHSVNFENKNTLHVEQFISEIMLMVNLWKTVKRDKTFRHLVNFSINTLLAMIVYWFLPSIIWGAWVFSIIAIYAMVCIFVVNIAINEQLRQAYEKIDKLEGLQYKKV